MQGIILRFFLGTLCSDVGMQLNFFANCHQRLPIWSLPQAGHSAGVPV